MRASSCKNNEATSVSINIFLYFMIAGMNHVKSNFDSSPVTDALDVIKITSPLYLSLN